MNTRENFPTGGALITGCNKDIGTMYWTDNCDNIRKVLPVYDLRFHVFDSKGIDNGYIF